MLVACDHDTDAVVDMIADATRRQRLTAPCSSSAAGRPTASCAACSKLGADDIVELPQSPENVRFLIEKAIARRAAARPRPGQVIVVLGPKGGTGKTLTACNLGCAAGRGGPPHRAGRPRPAVRRRRASRSACARTGRSTTWRVAGGTLDAEKVDDYLTHHQSGVRVLIAPARPDQAASVSVELLRELYPILQQRSSTT